MTLEQIKSDIESRLTAQINYLKSVQSNFKQSNGHFFSGPITHIDIPADGIEKAPDRKHINEPGFPAWEQVGTLPATMRSALTMKNYVTPDRQHGYFIELRFKHGQDTWKKVINVEGPESRFNQDWHIETNELPETPLE